ncbi:DUF4249 domain-containing protein [Leeuwenhoekiella sp. A16]|uniref:DUF4249 domain-containing protein n=1 Tax=unclassified Leeuwenhoekiella TaxID=2615029 RepID=UPI003A8109AC
MRIIRKIAVLLIGLLLTACEDVIDVDLDTAPPRLVVDASIDWLKNTSGNEQKIMLSTTTAYYSTEFPSVSGADITINNSKGSVFEFIEIPGTGEYVCTNFEPVLGEVYTLTILQNGERYTASEELVATSPIEDTIEQNNTGGFGADEIELTYYYRDDGTKVNYYLFGIKDSHIIFPQYSVEDDENNQGNLTPVYYSNKDLETGDLVSFKLYGISKRYYEYFKKVLVASGNDDGPFQSTPTAVRGNIINESNSADYTFGYFRLSEVDSKEYKIQDTDI